MPVAYGANVFTTAGLVPEFLLRPQTRSDLRMALSQVALRLALERYPALIDGAIELLRQAVAQQPDFVVMSHLLANTLYTAIASGQLMERDARARFEEARRVMMQALKPNMTSPGRRRKPTRERLRGHLKPPGVAGLCRCGARSLPTGRRLWKGSCSGRGYQLSTRVGSLDCICQDAWS